MDADAGQNKRKIKAFIGGLDLCVGRYDTPNHSIFRTLQTTHKDDYHNPNFEVNHHFCLIFTSYQLRKLSECFHSKYTFGLSVIAPPVYFRFDFLLIVQYYSSLTRHPIFNINADVKLYYISCQHIHNSVTF